MTLSTRSRLCCGVSGFCVMGDSLPLTFIEGGMPAVMKRSEAFWCAISLRNEVKSMLLICAPAGLGTQFALLVELKSTAAVVVALSACRRLP